MTPRVSGCDVKVGANDGFAKDLVPHAPQTIIIKERKKKKKIKIKTSMFLQYDDCFHSNCY